MNFEFFPLTLLDLECRFSAGCAVFGRVTSLWRSREWRHKTIGLRLDSLSSFVSVPFLSDASYSLHYSQGTTRAFDVTSCWDGRHFDVSFCLTGPHCTAKTPLFCPFASHSAAWARSGAASWWREKNRFYLLERSAVTLCSRAVLSGKNKQWPLYTFARRKSMSSNAQPRVCRVDATLAD